MTLVDTSVWIDYFKGTSDDELERLVATDRICVNDTVLAELLPSIDKRGERGLRDILTSITRIPVYVDWEGIIYMQTQNLLHGINNVGIANMIIAQNVIEHGLTLYSHDKHFALMSPIFGFALWH